ncbi:MAG: hypothetical protein HYV09_37985 [Deltaproteobacteria bacterium]|nr:hypothetical protein [Deltaproteobacteria bacterium]
MSAHGVRAHTARPSRLFVALAAVVGLLRWSWLPRAGALLAFLAFDVLRIRRAHVVSSLARAGFGDGGVRTARAVYRGLGASALELLWIAAHPEVPATSLVRVDGRARFDGALARGRGVIVATAHTGNWDLVGCACAGQTRLAVVTKRLSARSLDAWWQRTRASRGLDLLAAPDGDVLRAVRARLAEGGAVALLIDQDPERTRSVVAAPFLGEVALHDTLVATLAARTGASIAVAFGRRDPHLVDIVEVITPPPRAGRAWIEATTRAMAARLDAFVREDPACWLWLHRRWKTRLEKHVPRTRSSPGRALSGARSKVEG